MRHRPVLSPWLHATRRVARAVLVATLLFATAHADAAAQTTLRTRLQRNGPNGWYPVAGLVVTVRVNGPSGARSLPAYSGPDGMVSLYNVPPAQYFIEVWYQNAPTPFIVYPISVTYTRTPYGLLCDLPPIVIR